MPRTPPLRDSKATHVYVIEVREQRVNRFLRDVPVYRRLPVQKFLHSALDRPQLPHGRELRS